MTGLCLFLELGAQIATLLAKNVTLPIALAIKSVTCHAAVIPVAECDQELAAKSLPYLQCQGHCLTHMLMTYTY